MATSSPRRWLGTTLFFLALPLSALAQTAVIDVTPNAPLSGVAGTTFPSAGVGFQNTSGGTLTDVEIQFGALPAGVTWNTGSCVGGIDVTDLATTGVVRIASIDDTVNEVAICDLNAAPDVAEGTVFTVSAEWVSDPTINDTSSEITINRDVAFDLGVVCMPDSVLAGSGAGNLTCTLDFTQNGPSQATNVNVNLTLPSGVTVDSAVTSGEPSQWNPPINWALGTKNPGDTSSVVLTMTVDSSATGDLVIEAVATANELDSPISADDTVAAESASAAPTSFLTTIGFTNGYEGMVTVSISCNNGVPLNQSFEISPSQPVNFVVDLLDFVAPDTDCTITLDTVDDGYTGSFLANGVDTGDACIYSSEPEVGEAPFDGSTERANTCEITAEPVVSTFEVDKVWAFESNDTIEMSANIQIWCSPASSDTGPEFGTVSTFVTAYGDDSFTLQFYPDWDGGATCYAQESNLDSAVESDGGCADGTDFEIGDEEAGCTITNTVFFEGIPTLSQYGLALMALLMLGVGFVGLRRFV